MGTDRTILIYELLQEIKAEIKLFGISSEPSKDLKLRISAQIPSIDYTETSSRVDPRIDPCIDLSRIEGTSGLEIQDDSMDVVEDGRNVNIGDDGDGDDGEDGTRQRRAATDKLEKEEIRKILVEIRSLKLAISQTLLI